MIKFAKRVNILGTWYAIKVVPQSGMSSDEHSGEQNSRDKEIRVLDLRTVENYKKATDVDVEESERETLRHEIVHAFFCESGLYWSANVFSDAWCMNEEMVDWFAVQGPKICAAWKAAGCLTGEKNTD
jgi:hypothetical protein